MLFIFSKQFIFVSAFVHLDRTCIYSHMLRMVLAFGELLLTVSTESYSVDQHCGMAANANILGNSSKSTRDPGWFVGLFVFFFFPFWISRDGRRVGKLWIITPSGSSSEVHIQYQFVCFNMILVNVEERENRGSIHFFKYTDLEIWCLISVVLKY